MSASASTLDPQWSGHRLLDWMFVLFCIGMLTLFSDVKARVGGIVVKPFDAAALVTLPPMLVLLLASRCLRCSGATFVFGTFMVIHTWSAFALGNTNGIRESVQSAELVMIFLVLQALVERIDWRALGRVFLLALIGIVIYTAVWHVSHGFYAGWKRLDGPKLAFMVLPTLATAFLIVPGRKVGGKGWAILGLLLVVLVLSGERKAILQFVAMMGVLLALGFIDLPRFLLGAAFGVVLAAVGAASNEYIAAQFQSLLGFASERAASSAELQSGLLPTTMSNAQRVFAIGVSEYLIRENTFFGIGTNGYYAYVLSTYPGIAEWLTVPIHNEFMRVCVENGLLGLAAYAAIWLRAVALLVVRWRKLERAHRGMYLSFLAAAWFEVTFEGSGNEVFIVAIFVALLPDIFQAALTNSKRARPGLRQARPTFAPRWRAQPA